MSTDMGVVDKKVLGALLLLADDNMVVKTTMTKIANVMGYKATGGTVTYSLKLLEINNYISKLYKGTYKVLI